MTPDLVDWDVTLVRLGMVAVVSLCVWIFMRILK